MSVVVVSEFSRPPSGIRLLACLAFLFSILRTLAARSGSRGMPGSFLSSGGKVSHKTSVVNLCNDSAY